MLKRAVFITLAGVAMALLPSVVGQTMDPPKGNGMEQVQPSQADPGVRQHDEPNVVIMPQDRAAIVPLAIFLPGTGGRPQNAAALLRTIAGQGYRVIGLSYDDEPSLSKVCPRNPDPACSGRFREMRAFGRGPAPVDNPSDEAIDARLIALLKYLAREHPDENWGAYLNAEGRPEWSRILVSGLSQGAGMAAFIAKSYSVYRVVLFSSPWDTTGRNARPAPWLSRLSATPPERWWAERHAREKTTELIAHAYSALAIPKDHILIFNGGLGPAQDAKGENPYHGSTIRNPEYLSDWKKMYGVADASATQMNK